MGNIEGRGNASSGSEDDDAEKWFLDFGIKRQVGDVRPEKVRLALVGPRQSGKSSLSSRFLRNSFAVEHKLDKVVRHGVRSVALGNDGEKWVEVVDVPGNKTSYTGDVTAPGALRAEAEDDVSYGFQGVLGDLHKAVVSECDILCLVLRADGDLGSDVAAAPEAMARAVVDRADSVYESLNDALNYVDGVNTSNGAKGDGGGGIGGDGELNQVDRGSDADDALRAVVEKDPPRFAFVNRCDVLYDRGILTSVADTRRYLEIIAEWARKRRCEIFFVSAATDPRHCVSRSFKEMVRAVGRGQHEADPRQSSRGKELRRHFVSVNVRHSSSRGEMQRRAELFRDLFGRG